MTCKPRTTFLIPICCAGCQILGSRVTNESGMRPVQFCVQWKILAPPHVWNTRSVTFLAGVSQFRYAFTHFLYLISCFYMCNLFFTHDGTEKAFTVICLFCVCVLFFVPSYNVTSINFLIIPTCKKPALNSYAFYQPCWISCILHVYFNTMERRNVHLRWKVTWFVFWCVDTNSVFIYKAAWKSKFFLKYKNFLRLS